MSPIDDDVINRPFNAILRQKHQQIRGAVRFALSTVCDPNGKPLRNAVLRKQLLRVQINASTTGDTILIPAGVGGLKQIYEMVVWNVTGQTLTFQQGFTASNPIVQLRLTDFPDATGYTMGFCGSFDFPHWEIDNGSPLVLHIDGGTQVDGFIVYRVQNGTDAT